MNHFCSYHLLRNFYISIVKSAFTGGGVVLSRKDTSASKCLQFKDACFIERMEIVLCGPIISTHKHKSV